MERQYVGIDFHRRRSVIVRMDQAGEVLSVVRVENDPLKIAEQVEAAGPKPEVVIERPMAGTGWSTCSRSSGRRCTWRRRRR